MKVSAEIRNEVAKISSRIRKNTPEEIKKGLFKSGGIVKRAAVARGPRVRKLAQTVKVTRLRVDKDGQPMVKVGFAKNRAYYLKFFESGTRRHVIKAKNAKYLKFPIGGKFRASPIKGKIRTQTESGKWRSVKFSAAAWIRAKQVNHPGIRAKPFLQPAANAVRGEVTQVMADAVKAALNRIGGG